MQLSIAVVGFVVAATACRPTGPPGSEPIEISLNGQGDSITIVGDNVSRAALLKDLKVRHDIELRAEVPDARISPHIERQPLFAAIEQILPPGTRYAVRIGQEDRLVGFVPRTDKKTGGRDIRSDTLPTKDRTRPFQPSPSAALKHPADQPYRPTPAEGPRFKPPAEAVLRVPEAKGPKVDTQRVSLPDSSVRLSFHITAPDSIRLVDARLVPGSAPVTGMVQGPFLFAVRVGGRVVHFGAILDPLEQHSYLDDGTHDVGRAAEGAFGIWLPPEVVKRIGVAAFTVEFYDGRAVTLPQVLDERTFRAAAERAKRITLHRVAQPRSAARGKEAPVISRWRCLVLGLLLVAPREVTGQTVATLLRSAANASKKNLVVVGDGFTAAQQAAFNDYVDAWSSGICSSARVPTARE